MVIPELTHTREELQEHLLALTDSSQVAPGLLTIDHYSPELIAATTTLDESQLRPGGIVSGPALFRVVDQMAYLVTISRAPKDSNGFTSAVAMQFLRPAKVGRMRAEGRLLRFSKRASIVDVILYGDSLEEPVAQAVVTYVPRFPPG
jgi:acyl-coenzyme A thioesterase PaaI-like protein